MRGSEGMTGSKHPFTGGVDNSSFRSDDNPKAANKEDDSSSEAVA